MAGAGQTDIYYLVYEINGQSMGVLPPRINRGFFESRFIHKYPTSEVAEKKLLSYYIVKDPSLLEHEREKAELLAMYPDCAENPFYLLDPEMTERETMALLSNMAPTAFTFWHTWQKGTPYDTSDIALFENLETFELSEELK